MYYTTQGKGFTQSQVERKIKEAKKKLVENKHGQLYCDICGNNQGFIDCSHIVSVKFSKEFNMLELCWLFFNIILECRNCHLETENQSKAIRFKRMLERAPESWYYVLLEASKHEFTGEWLN